MPVESPVRRGGARARPLRAGGFLLGFLLVVLTATPALAVKEWYDYYGDAQRDIAAARYDSAIASLQAAVKLKPGSAVNEQTYGLQFVDYLPYYYWGLCYLKKGDFNSAVRYFNIEESFGAINHSALRKDLVRMRREAQDAEGQRVARLAREETERLQKEAAELARARNWDEALARLAQAQKAAASLDPQTQRTIADSIGRIRAEQTASVEAAARSKRIEQALTEADRLAQEGKDGDAAVRYAEVLTLDPKNAHAEKGKQEAEQRIAASQTRATLQQAFDEGAALFNQQKYEEALKPLTVAATDPANAKAQAMIAQARATLERIRLQQDLRDRSQKLEAEGDQLLAEGHFPQAEVRLRALVDLDPTNLKAKEKLDEAERKTGEAIVSRWMPNEQPDLTFIRPRPDPARPDEVAVKDDTLSVAGVASDDRGVTRLDFRLDGQIVAQQPLPPPRASDSTRSVLFEREFPLRKGTNQLTVVVTDTQGLTRERTFRVDRVLRWWEEPAFMPSALASAVGLVGLGMGAQRARRRRAVRRRFNPYIAGAPVMTDDMFFGRDKLLRRILNVLHHNSLMITGERRIGKTTFLYHLRKALEADEGSEYKFFPVFVDLQGVPEDAFFHTVMSDVVEALGLPESTRAQLRFDARRELPFGGLGAEERSDGAPMGPSAGIHSRRELPYDGRDFSHDVQKVIEELKERTPRHVKLALLIDEVDVLNEYSERVNQRLRSIFMKTFSEHLVAIMSGVGVKRIWNSEGSPWYNFFDEVELVPFTREEAEALVREPVQGVFRYEPEAVEHILSYSLQKPYLVQKLCIHAVNQMLEHDRTVITVDDVESAREAVQREGRDPDATSLGVAEGDRQVTA